MLQGHLTLIVTAIFKMHMSLIQPGDVSGLDYFSSSLVESSAQIILHRKWSSMDMKNAV